MSNLLSRLHNPSTRTIYHTEGPNTTSRLGSIVIQGRGTEVTLYTIDPKTAEYWAERDQDDLSNHIHSNGSFSTGDPKTDSEDAQFPIRSLSNNPVFRHAKGIRFEHGFKVLSVEPGFDKINDITGNVAEVNSKIIRMGTRSPIDSTTILEFTNNEVPTDGILTIETNETGHLEFICPLYRDFQPSLVELMVAHQGDWPIVYGIKYDGTVLDLFEDGLKPYGVPSAHVCIFI